MNSIFDKPGLYLRNPAGGVEDIQAMKDAGFEWVAFNIGDHNEEEWDVVIERARNIGVAAFPWRQCFNNEQVDSLCEMSRLRYGSRVIVNVEKPLDLGYVTIEVVRDCSAGMDACISTEPWLFDSIDWTRVNHLPIELQLFPQENNVSKDPRNCRAHAFSIGALRTKFQYGIHELQPGAFPPRGPKFSVYAGDDAAGNFGVWTAQPVLPVDIPYTGPLYGPGHVDGASKSKTVKALKIAMHNAGFGTFSNPDLLYNRNLMSAMMHFQRDVGITPTSGNYGRGSYEAIKKLLSVFVGGSYALDGTAQTLIKEDAGV